MAVIAIMKKRIYVFVISLMILAYKLVLTLLYLGNSIKIFAATGQETGFILINVFSVIFVLTFLAKINKKYPSMIYGSDLYYQKLKTLEGADKADFVNGIEDSLRNDDIEEFARLLDLECEITNEEYKKQVEEGTYLEDNNGEIITDSRLLGASISFFFFNLLCGILTVITLGIAYPFIVVMKEKYLAKRTYTTGHKNIFDGNGFQLIGKYILWLFLTVITFGIYSIFLIAKLIAWKTAHTHFFDSEVKESKYTGNGFVRYFLNIALTILAGITLGLAYPFKVCALQRYDKNNSIIDGYKLRFTGTAMQYFGKHILWTLLSIVTIGIYYIFVPFKKQRWIREHTIIDETYANTIQPKKVEVVEDVRPEIVEEIKVEENAVEENIENNSGSENKENVVEESSIDENIIEDNKEES